MDDGEMFNICYRIELKEAIENRFKLHILTSLDSLGNDFINIDRIYNFLWINYRRTENYSYQEIKHMLKRMVKSDELIYNGKGYKSVSLDMLKG